jgi:hypothetical protein
MDSSVKLNIGEGCRSQTLLPPFSDRESFAASDLEQRLTELPSRPKTIVGSSN